MSEPVKIAIVIEGGLVSQVLTAGVPVECIIIDHDTDGCDPDELSDPAGVGLARVYREDVCDDPTSRKTVMLAHENTPGGSGDGCEACAASIETRLLPCDECGALDGEE